MARREITFIDEQGNNWKAIEDIKKYIKETKLMQLEKTDIYDDDGNIIEDGGGSWKDVAVDIAKISLRKFGEVQLPFGNIHELCKLDDAEQAHLESYSELNYFLLRYYILNNIHPNVYRFEDFNVDMFMKKLFKTFTVPNDSYLKVTFQGSGDPRINSIIISFGPKIYFYLDGNDGTIFYDPLEIQDEDSVFYRLLGLLKGLKRPKVTKNKIYIVYQTQHGFEKTGFEIKKTKVNLEENYNDDFPPIAKEIIDGLNDKKKSNLVILTGDPGTGKTTFIRYLTSNVKKNIIFISPDMAESITDPAFIPFLMKNKDAILIMEDAEPALKKRDQGGRSGAVSNVLNLTDGLLSDCLKISIVATFNTGMINIDEALTRRGRLLKSYKFDKLKAEKAKILLTKLGHDEISVKEDMTLADIYFYGTETNNEAPQKGVGFKFKNNV